MDTLAGDDRQVPGVAFFSEGKIYFPQVKKSCRYDMTLLGSK